jgi:glycylpeptide N-tetradecanoyltransferase
VEDPSSAYRFEYSKELLQWALMPPGWRRDWHIGVRVSETKKMVAFISGVPALISVRDV